MPSPFLNLPAELRIKIYDLVSASSSEHPIKIHHEKGGCLGTYAALARVNRQVRDEYIQEHRRNAHVSLSYSNIQESSLFSRSPIENLQIRLSYLNPSELEYVDLLPLLENKARFGPNFRCTFVNVMRPFHAPPRIIGSRLNYDDWSWLDTWTLWLNSFLAHANPYWEEIILDHNSELAAVCLRIRDDPPHLRLIFKLEHPSGDPTWDDMQKTYLPMMGMSKGAKWCLASDFRTWRLSIVGMDKAARLKAGLVR